VGSGAFWHPRNCTDIKFCVFVARDVNCQNTEYLYNGWDDWVVYALCGQKLHSEKLTLTVPQPLHALVIT